MASPCSGLSGSIDSTTPIGIVEVLATAAGIFQINLKGTTGPVRAPSGELTESALSRRALQQLNEYLHGQRREFDLPIDWSVVKDFQKKVLEAALLIPFGKLMTYGQLATAMGNSAASRAIGGAMGHNPLPLLIPCHRVVAADGRLTGYSAADGIRTKCWLLELEGHRVTGERLV
jgi:O-6-methylguanine DNA methyltransferase